MELIRIRNICGYFAVSVISTPPPKKKNKKNKTKQKKQQNPFRPHVDNSLIGLHDNSCVLILRISLS